MEHQIWNDELCLKTNKKRELTAGKSSLPAKTLDEDSTGIMGGETSLYNNQQRHFIQSDHYLLVERNGTQNSDKTVSA